MNKQVYLFELDSVRKTDAEIKKGQDALYDEILGNGNTVILSMNQITDSKSILCMLYDEKKYEFLKTYLMSGKIKISRFGTVRTASQYIQNAIDKNLAKNNDVFIFSALPVKSNQKRLLLLMKEVLVNADLSLMKEYLDGVRRDELVGLFDSYDEDGVVISEEQGSKVPDEQLRVYFKILYRFLELVLLISMSDISSNPAIHYQDGFQSKPFLDFMKCILALKYDGTEKDAELWEGSCDVLKLIMERSKGDEEIYQDRSVWITELRRYSEKTADQAERKSLQYAELIVNLCYNYTVEYSIWGSSKHYSVDSLGNESVDNSFGNEFFSRLAYEWNDGECAEERFLQPESNVFRLYDGPFPAWRKGNRIIGRRAKIQNGRVESPIYEYRFDEERKARKKIDRINIGKVIVTTVAYIALIFLIDQLMSRVESFLGEVIKSSVIFLVLIVASTCVDRILQVPDIFECVKMVGLSIADFLIINRQKVATYLNRDNLNNATMNAVPEYAAQKKPFTTELRDYQALYGKRKELFEHLEQMPIVLPDKEEQIQQIREYEMIHNVKIGVNYKSKYHMYLVDLIQEKGKKPYTYERLVPTVPQGAVVVIPKYQEKWILLEQFRHAMRDYQTAFPRGYGELDKSGNCLAGAVNACKEICEELGVDEAMVGKPRYLGDVVADSGVCGNKVAVYMVEVKEYKVQVGYEGIQNVRLMSDEEFVAAMKEKEINDGFTLAAWSLYRANVGEE